MGKARPNWTKEAKRRALLNSQSPGKRVYCCIRGLNCEWKGGVRRKFETAHREHNITWASLKQKHGISSRVFNQGSPIALACPTCNLQRGGDTPPEETVSRNCALFKCLRVTCIGITPGWIERALLDYPPFLVPTVGPEVDYPAIKVWLVNQWTMQKKTSKKKL